MHFECTVLIEATIKLITSSIFYTLDTLLYCIYKKRTNLHYDNTSYGVLVREYKINEISPQERMCL